MLSCARGLELRLKSSRGLHTAVTAEAPPSFAFPRRSAYEPHQGPLPFFSASPHRLNQRSILNTSPTKRSLLDSDTHCPFGIFDGPRFLLWPSNQSRGGSYQNCH